ncbi:unnamed protein product [Arabidopsis lyrata]|nr:unnamed protein product [Arabidopsis lyrata]
MCLLSPSVCHNPVTLSLFCHPNPNYPVKFGSCKASASTTEESAMLSTIAGLWTAD